jgi:hypothetical protein
LTRIIYFDRRTKRVHAASIWVAAAFVPLLSSCALVREWTDPTTVSVRGVPPTLEQLNISASAAAQNQLVGDLVAATGLSSEELKTRGDAWSLATKAGIYEIGRQCDQYLDVLFRFNREQRAGRQDLAAAAAATGAIMGLTGVSSKAIGIAAAAFGLATGLFDASVNSVLFTIEPSALRNVALQGRKKYLEDLKKNNVKINSRPDMLIVLQGYLTQCSPAAIEANINNAASGAPSVAVLDEQNPERAAVLAAPATVLLQPSVGPPTELGPPQEPGPGPEGARRQAQAKKIVVGQVTPTPPPPEQFLAPNRQLPGEKDLLKSDVMHAQDALGITPADGDPGVLGSTTRKEIADFQRGMNARDARNWPAVSGLFTDRATASTLPNLLPMPQEFKSPFERAYLGNYIINKSAREQLTGVDPNRLSLFLQRDLGVPKEQLQAGNSPQAIGANMAIMRDRIAKAQEQRAQQQNGSVSGEKGVLDATLYDYLKRNPLPKGGSGG